MSENTSFTISFIAGILVLFGIVFLVTSCLDREGARNLRLRQACIEAGGSVVPSNSGTICIRRG